MPRKPSGQLGDRSGGRSDMDEVKKRLEQELNRTVERLRQMGGPLLAVDVMNRVGDTSQLADEVDVIQVNEDREMNFATRSLLVERANRLAEALERLRGGDYGTCGECGEPIPPAPASALARGRTWP